MCMIKMDDVTEGGIRQLVDAFYARVRKDPELGPVFNRAIDNWQLHLEKMYAFWSSIMLTTGRYKGNPLLKHVAVPGIRPEMFARWLALFDETCCELFDHEVSEMFRVKAERIAGSLMFGIYHHNEVVDRILTAASEAPRQSPLG